MTGGTGAVAGNPGQSGTRSWLRRPRVRLSLRAVMIFILFFGGGLGWVVNRANVQRDAVAAIEQAGGKVTYDWELTPMTYIYGNSFKPNPKGMPKWPKWLVARLGPDYFGSVKTVILGPESTDATTSHVGRLAQLEELDADKASRLTNAGLVHLRALTGLRMFIMGPSPGVTGAGLVNVAGLTRLERLGFSGIPVDDADLVHLRGLANLRMLRLNGGGGGITDEGMANLKELVQLRELIVRRSKITGDGLVSLNQMNFMHELILLESRVQTLEPLRRMTALQCLWVVGSPLDDAGLKPAEHLTSLRYLHLGDTRVEDEGLKFLVGLESLREVNVKGTGVTAEGAASFRKARPKVGVFR